MKPATAFVIAGETSGDQLGSELVREWRQLAPGTRFLGAGGPALASAGVQLSTDLTAHSVIGLWEVLTKYRTFRRLFHQLLEECIAARPEVIVGVDYGGFNLRFANAIRERGAAIGWRPRLVQFVSPQVWASRPGRARRMEQSHDLLLSILPFEKAWYATHAPGLQVEFVGHPIVDRHADTPATPITPPDNLPRLLLLPGSRTGELQRHLPVLIETLDRLRPHLPFEARLILPHQRLVPLARTLGAGGPRCPEPEVGGLPDALRQTTLALASTGTVTLECAWFGVPTLALYRTSWLTYQVGKRIVTVSHLAMPNLLANRTVMPEFIQGGATAERIADTALAWLREPTTLQQARTDLNRIVAQLGPPGAPRRAARLIVELLQRTTSPVS